MKWKWIIWVIMVFGAAFLLFTGEALLTQRALAAKTLRFHVVANSDSREDQEQKLRLRDHLLKELESITGACRTMPEAEAALASAQLEIETSAREFLRAEGSDYGVSVSLCREHYGTRHYGSFSLPAGSYHSLRILIGEGQGKNWWCVVFPALCNASSIEGLEEQAREGGYGEEELGLIQRDTPQYQLRFKVLEWIDGLFH